MTKIILIILAFYSFPIFSQNAAQLDEMWKKAIRDSSKFSALKQERPLFSIGPTNMRLVLKCKKEWGCEGGTKDWFKNKQFKRGIRVAVLTWINNKYNDYDPYVENKKLYYTGSRPIWVTAVPEIKLFCTGLGDLKKTKLRLEQFKGLPYNGSKDEFVTMWVEPRRLFRPCPDPEIYDAKCGITFPENTSAIHKNWINQQAEKSFPSLGQGYPWTRRGFAYDWGEKNYQGASEYIISPGSSIYIESIERTETYCQVK